MFDFTVVSILGLVVAAFCVVAFCVVALCGVVLCVVFICATVVGAVVAGVLVVLLSVAFSGFSVVFTSGFSVNASLLVGRCLFVASEKWTY